MKWNLINNLPYIGQYILMEDHEGNWTTGVFTGQYTKLDGMPPFGLCVRWVGVSFTPNGDVITDCGHRIKDSEIFEEFYEYKSIPKTK